MVKEERQRASVTTFADETSSSLHHRMTDFPTKIVLWYHAVIPTPSHQTPCRQGDITKLDGVDAIVNAANKSLLGGGGGIVLVVVVVAVVAVVVVMKQRHMSQYVRSRWIHSSCSRTAPVGRV